MNQETIRALNAINRRFYEERADEFDRTRERAWAGWSELFDRYGDRLPTSPRILDLGCGNGRFVRFLRGRGVEKLDYFGVDASSLGLAHARERLPNDETIQWFEHDFIVEESPVPKALDDERFDLIVLFGVLHHVPGKENRVRILTYLANRLRSGGLLAYTVWHFDRFERFTRKLIPWNDFLRDAPETLDRSQLEPGDHIMTWGDSRPAHRYCHAMSDEEAETLVRALPLRSIASFPGDDDLNAYYVLAN